MSISSDPIVLNYHDSLLRLSDLKLLDNNSQWLNDNIISFSFEYFELCQFSKCPSYGFLNPGFVQIIKFAQENELKSLLEMINIHSKSLVFIPVNNNNSFSAGGSHWSLLVLNIEKKECLSFDSANNMNEDTSLKIFNILNKYFNNEYEFIEMPTPQQNNSCDCGMYVICIVEELCHQYSYSKNFFKNLCDINQNTVLLKRKYLKELIESLKHSELY